MRRLRAQRRTRLPQLRYRLQLLAAGRAHHGRRRYRGNRDDADGLLWGSVWQRGVSHHPVRPRRHRARHELGTTTDADPSEVADCTGRRTTYLYSPSANGTLTITVEGNTDLAIASGLSCDSARLAACSNTAAAGEPEVLELRVDKSSDLYLTISAAEPGQEGDFDVTIELQPD